VLRLDAWRASRSGLDDVLLSPVSGQPEPPRVVVNALLEHVRHVLEEAGDTPTVTGPLAAVLACGNGPALQRSAHRGGSLSSMIDSAAAATAR
jgi:carboxylate-amine ligase